LEGREAAALHRPPPHPPPLDTSHYASTL